MLMFVFYEKKCNISFITVYYCCNLVISFFFTQPGLFWWKRMRIGKNQPHSWLVSTGPLRFERYPAQSLVLLHQQLIAGTKMEPGKRNSSVIGATTFRITTLDVIDYSETFGRNYLIVFPGVFFYLMLNEVLEPVIMLRAGNTEGGSITVQLTSCWTGLD